MYNNVTQQRLSVFDFNALRNEGKKLQIIDVRSTAEFAAESLDGSVNIPLDVLSNRSKEISKQAEVFLICRSGKRAEQAAGILSKAGYSVKILEGGLLAWRQAGLPLTKGSRGITPERQAQVLIGLAIMICAALGLWGSKLWVGVAGVLGLGTIFTALTGNCALAMLLSKAPWNSPAKTAEKHSSCCG